MKRKGATRLLLAALALSCVIAARPARADVEWSVIKDLNLEASPLDVSISADGKMIFVLAPGEVLIYSVPEYKVMKQIPLEEGFNRLTYFARDNALILTNSFDNALRIIRLEMVYDIPVSGLPYKGPENAPITIVAFNDYQ